MSHPDRSKPAMSVAVRLAAAVGVLSALGGCTTAPGPHRLSEFHGDAVRVTRSEQALNPYAPVAPGEPIVDFDGVAAATVVSTYRETFEPKDVATAPKSIISSLK